MVRSRSYSDQKYRSGFTLIEVIVVMAIIGILIALLLPAVQKIREIGPRTANYDEMAQVGAAIGEYKTALKISQLPSGPFHLMATYTGNEPELSYLLQVFPQMAWAGSAIPGSNGLPVGTDFWMDSNQTLLFFLAGLPPDPTTNPPFTYESININPDKTHGPPFNGFATNPAQPFLPGKVGDSRIGPFLKPSDTLFAPNKKNTVLGSLAKTVASTTSFLQVPGAKNVGAQSPPITITFGPTSMPWLVDPYGMPYAYFAPLNGKNGLYCAPPSANGVVLNCPSSSNNFTGVPQSYTTTFTTGTSYTVTPYISNNTYINPTGFQIISPGRDMFFGPGATQIPGLSTGEDDQANFSKTLLGGGIN
jgi:prepilin-type N-terminal cleavage/methylation domain-containing protein